MRFSSFFVAAATPLLAVAAPVKWTRSAANVNSVVLKFALLLEQLETEFYTQALAKFVAADFTAAGIAVPDIAIQNFQAIQAHEAAHVQIITDTLAQVFGERGIEGCSFNFDSVLTDVTTMAAVARTVEHVGVAAYMGGANLLDDRTILAAAAAILPIEARHQSFLNTIAGAANIPQAFDVALTPQDVLSIAGAFVSGCDPARELGLPPANPPLAVQNTGAIVAGTQLQFDSPAIGQLNGVSGVSCQMLVGGAATTLSLPIEQCIVPQGIAGPVWVWITRDSQPLAANINQRNAESILAGPTAIFLDVQADALGALVRNVGNGSVFHSSNNISPSEAADLLSSAANPAPSGGLNVGQNNAAPNGAVPAILDLGVHTIPSSASR